jgi:ATP-binding cassette, subfamily F, member 3
VPGGTTSRSTATNGSTPDEPKPKRAARAKGPSKNRLSAQAQAEADVEAAEAAMRALEDELADPAAWATRYESAKSEARHTAARRAVDAAYERLESLID